MSVTAGTPSMTPALDILHSCLAAAEPETELLNESVRSRFKSFGDFEITSSVAMFDNSGAFVSVLYDRSIYERVSTDEIMVSVVLRWDRSSKHLEVTINDVTVTSGKVKLTNEIIAGIVNGVGAALAKADSETEVLRQHLNTRTDAIKSDLQSTLAKLLKKSNLPPVLLFPDIRWEVARRD